VEGAQAGAAGVCPGTLAQLAGAGGAQGATAECGGGTPLKLLHICLLDLLCASATAAARLDHLQHTQSHTASSEDVCIGDDQQESWYHSV
jgi:hypothetical protein